MKIQLKNGSVIEIIKSAGKVVMSKLKKEDKLFLKYPCHICKRDDCNYRQIVEKIDIEHGLVKYCDYGFERY